MILMVLSSWLVAIAKVHPVHLMNADWVLGGCQHPDQANQLGLWIANNWQLPSTYNIAI